MILCHPARPHASPCSNALILLDYVNWLWHKNIAMSSQCPLTYINREGFWKAILS